MKSFYLQILEYNYHFNQKLIGCFLASSELISERALALLNHIINAQQIWNNRILPEDTLYEIWEQHTTNLLESIDHNNYEKSIRIVNDLELHSIVQYSNSKGEIYNNSIQDILYHIVNHATYHRGQIAVEFRKSRIEPLVTNYIFFKR